MRFVFLGNHRVDYSSETHWVKSIESLGHDVVKLQEGQATGDEVLAESLKSDGLIWVHTHGWKTSGLPILDVLKQLKSKKVPSIAYHLDLYMGLERWKEYENDPYLNSVEYFFTVDKLMADWLNKNTKTKAFFLPAGVFDQECILPEPWRVKFDIVFTGSKNYHPEWPYRPQLVEWLHNNYGRRFVHIGNDGEVGPRRGLQLNQIYRNAKIVVGDTLNIGFNYPYYASDRLFEVPGRSGFNLFPDIEGLDEFYEDGKEIVFYKHGDFNDLRNKIDYYLTHAEEREAIRLAGFERTKRDHTYVRRWEDIIEVVYG